MNINQFTLITLFLIIQVASATAGQITIGTDTYNALMPIHPLYNWSYSQTIYTPEEVNLEDSVIERLSFYWSGGAAGPNSCDWTVYLGNTTQNVFYEPYYGWVPVSAMTLVYSGTLQIPAQAGWVEILLDIPFQYTQGSHLVVAVDENSPGNEYHGGYFHGHEGNMARAIYFHSNTVNPDPTAPPTGQTNSKIPNIRLGYSSLTEVPNPSQFNASADGIDSIWLEWELNSTQDNVLIAYNCENIFGNPSGSYSPGDTIEGCGTVLLSDSGATSFIHAGLEPNQFLYYRIWSHDGSGYSNSMGSKSATSVSPITIFPWEETFEYDSATQRLWIVSEGDLHWQYAGETGSGGTGISQVANFFSFAENSETTFHLYSPDFETPQYTDAQLSFDYAHAGRSGRIDRMEIWYSTNRGDAWVLLADLEGGPNGVLNTAGIHNYRFVPTADDWENMSLLLPAGTNKLRFTSISAKGNNLYLDNIRITHSEPDFLEAPLLNITRSSNGFMLSWEEISAANEYHIYRALLPEGEFEYLDSTTSLNYEDTQVQDKAFYRVRAGGVSGGQ